MLFGDKRGYFVETYWAQRYADAEITAAFVQVNLSCSLRGLYFRYLHDLGKLVCLLEGKAFEWRSISAGLAHLCPLVSVTLTGRGKQQL